MGLTWEAGQSQEVNVSVIWSEVWGSFAGGLTYGYTIAEPLLRTEGRELSGSLASPHSLRSPFTSDAMSRLDKAISRQRQMERTAWKQWWKWTNRNFSIEGKTLLSWTLARQFRNRPFSSPVISRFWSVEAEPCWLWQVSFTGGASRLVRFHRQSKFKSLVLIGCVRYGQL